ncbi:MAG: phosphoserine phosphatase SerB [Robiginitomaculum sp.]|nr:MAG: phosphoserine phosphatase SerB [Robiginitomaculum sp.]
MTATTLILVSRPDDPALYEARTRAEALGWKHMSSLSPGEALTMRGVADHGQLQEAFADIPVDWCVRDETALRIRLLICDMDSTIINEECLDELADLAGIGEEVRTITAAAMSGEMDFEEALRTRVGLLKGKPVSLLQECFEERIHLNKGVRVLTRTMRAKGAATALVSGGFTFFTNRVAQLAGFTDHQANEILEDNGILTGAVASPVLGRQAKAEALQTYCEDQSITPEQVLAIGDGANDVAMVSAAGLGIAYRAKPILVRAAKAQIRHTDLTTALFFQGFRRKEFVGVSS